MTTVLVVDDNEQNLYQLQVLLAGSGYEVVCAANGSEALARARQTPPDVIVSDILMPVMDGFSLCREWKKDERLRAVPFIFYTATYTEDRDREFALSLGAERFMVKPVEPEEFLRNIREVLRPTESRSAAPAPPADAPVPRPAPAPAEEAVYLRQYNETLIRKLERKMQQLEQANRELERDVAARREAEARMAEQLEELRRWHAATVGRENRVLELKREVNELLEKAGQPLRYPSALGEAVTDD
jgi:CheY-like chemotaxis protein